MGQIVFRNSLENQHVLKINYHIFTFPLIDISRLLHQVPR